MPTQLSLRLAGSHRDFISLRMSTNTATSPTRTRSDETNPTAPTNTGPRPRAITRQICHTTAIETGHSRNSELPDHLPVIEQILTPLTRAEAGQIADFGRVSGKIPFLPDVESSRCHVT